MLKQPRIKISLLGRLLLLLIRFVDMVQGAVLKNYAVFSVIVRYAPQKLGAAACYYRALREVQVACRRVPAYREFLLQRGWSCPSANPREILRSLPLMDKQNYILAFSTETRCLDGTFFSKGVVVDESSGATGIPYNWVRSETERDIVKSLIGVYLRYCFGAEKFVVLNMFSMGAWATGFNMALAAQSLGVVKSTGPDVDKILHTLDYLGTKYPYILNGYPPFLKYLFDEGDRRGFNWKTFTLHGLVGGEGMSEGLRDYLLKYTRTVYSGYGASDLEIGMAGENPLTVMIRKLCQNDLALRKTVFGDEHRLPMLFQYNPLDHLVEIIDREIVVTINKPWTLSPRIRYNIKDEGGMLTFDEMKEKLAAHGIDLRDLERKCSYPRWYLPFLFVYGRKDSTVSVMGANIYPEDVETIVYSVPLLARAINAFAISLEEDEGNPRPCFEFELLDLPARNEVETTLHQVLSIEMARLNLDYRKAKDEYPKAVEPIVRTYGMHEGPFEANLSRIKRRYIKKTGSQVSAGG
jgi:phenylacetate-CoA ligase